MKTTYLLTTLTLGVLSLSACKEKGTTGADIHHGENHFASYEVAGLKLELPAAPIIGDIQLPEELKSVVAAFETYKVTDGSAQISIIHSTYNTADISLDSSADGTIAQIRSFPDVSAFVSNKEPVSVAGLPGRNLEFTYTKGAHVMNHHILVFIRGMELWQIQVISRNTSSAAATKILRDHVFGSVELLD